MNILDLQNQLKNLSEEQLIQEMQAPTGSVPQFLVLGEITRRQKMRTAFEGQQDRDETTVAQDSIAAAGVPSEFAGQMAGSMAPQTDMEGNTGVVPQAPMMAAGQPMGAEPVPGMAGGGIVALQSGGRVGSSRSFVRDGMVYIVNDRGEEVPWAPVSQVPGMDVDVASGANIGAGRATPDRFADETGPFSPVPPTGPATPPQTPRPPATAEDIERWRGDMRNVVGGVITPPLQAMDQSALGQVRLQVPAAPAPSPGQTRAPFPPNMTPAQIEAYAISAKSPGILGTARNLAEQAVDYGISRPGAFLTDRYGRLLSSLGMPGAGAANLTTAEATRDRIARRGEEREARGEKRALDADFIRFMGDPTTEGAAGILPGAVPTSPQAQGPVTEDPVAPADPQAVAEAEALADAQAAAAQPGGIAGMGAGAPSGGGIASVAGAAATEPSSFEQEMLDMLAARERRAEQDRWLSLAQFGLALMSSKEPTLGGAIGEAGGPALESLRSGRESAEGDRLGMLQMLEQYRMGQAQLALQQQAAAARAAGGGGGDRAVPAAVINNLMGQLSEIETELARLPAPPAPGIFGGQKQDRNAAARTQLTESRDRIRDVLNAAGAQYGLPLGGMPGAGPIPLN